MVAIAEGTGASFMAPACRRWARAAGASKPAATATLRSRPAGAWPRGNTGLPGTAALQAALRHHVRLCVAVLKLSAERTLMTMQSNPRVG